MNSAPTRLCANEPNIASKIMDGEAILINLQTGVYYSLREAGAVAWHALTAHRTADEIVHVVAAHFHRPPLDVRAEVVDLLEQLQADGLVRSSSRDRAIDAPPAWTSPMTPYAAPILEKFTDMGELLALDPPTPGALDGLMRHPIGGRDD